MVRRSKFKHTADWPRVRAIISGVKTAPPSSRAWMESNASWFPPTKASVGVTFRPIAGVFATGARQCLSVSDGRSPLKCKKVQEIPPMWNACMRGLCKTGQEVRRLCFTAGGGGWCSHCGRVGEVEAVNLIFLQVWINCCLSELVCLCVNYD